MVAFLNSLLAASVGGTAAVATAQSVCVYNHAAFDLHWRLRDTDHGTASADTKSYPVYQTRCMSALKAGANVTDGTSLVPAVRAVWGKAYTPSDVVLYDRANATAITYICYGTTLDYHCVQKPPPPTAADVMKDVGKFVLGFTEGLGAEIGFSKCLADVNSTYRDIVAVVDFFEAGINHRTLPAIAKAFELIGHLLKGFGAAIADCAKEAAHLAKAISDLAKALSGDVFSVIKVVIDELVRIFHDRSEITDDCKSTATHWRAVSK